MNEQNNKSKNTIIIMLGLVIVLLVIGITVGLANLNSYKKQNTLANNEGNVAIVNNNKKENIIDTNLNELKNTLNPESNTVMNNTTDENNTVNVATTNTTVNNVTANNNTTTENVVKNNDEEITAINVAIVNGVKITVPTTKEVFDKIGWEWDPSRVNTDLASGYTSSGGRVGKYPGGAVVSVLNTSGETKKFKDCIIDDVYFYNPGDGSENVTFIGGLDYNSTEEDVKNTFAKLGYKNVEEYNNDSDYGTYRSYKYFLNDDSSNFMDSIEFTIIKGVINEVSIKTSGE